MALQAPSVARDAVLKESSPLPEDMPQIIGYDFNQGVDHKALLQSFLTTGFQASSFGQAVLEINKMVSDCCSLLSLAQTWVILYKKRLICCFGAQKHFLLLSLLYCFENS